MPGLQEWIHAMEEGRGAKIIKTFLFVFGFVAIALVYNYFCFKNFHIPEAMDSAQLARNLSEGKGYTTDYVRPFSIHLLKEHRDDQSPLLETAHPDLANAPVYPALLAALFKVAPLKYSISTKATFSSYQPERWIAGFNQLLFFGAVVLVFFLAWKLFNQTIAWISVLVLGCSELLWRFSVSGLSTMLLMVLVLGAFYCLLCMDESQREETPSTKKLIGFAILTGILIGLAGLTRYSFLWLILPALVFAALINARFRIKVPFLMLLSFLIVVAPWIVRNKTASGAMFGVSSYAVLEQTAGFPGDTLQRTLSPTYERVTLKNLTNKLFVNSRNILENQVPTLGGSWVAAFFLVGLLVPFKNPTAARVRLFLAATLLLFVAMQALGRTHLSDVSKEINSENLLIVFAPLVFVFGVGSFYVLIQQLKLENLILTKLIYGVFVAVVSLPLVFALLPPRTPASAYPPYHPVLIQEASSWMNEGELMMSDLPWAVAWYGDRQCADLTLDRDKQFFAISDDMKKVHALYLSPEITDAKFLSQIMQSKTWEQLAFQAVARGGDSLTGFPLKHLRSELLPQHIFLADWERWKMPKK